MGIYVKFTITTHQIWPCHVTLASNSENFYFLPNSNIKFYEKFPDLGEIGSRTNKLQAKNKTQGGKHPPPVLIGSRLNNVY